MKEKILSILIFAFLLLVIGMTSVNAADYSVYISAPSGNFEVGKTVSVTVSFSPAVGQVEMYLNYDSAKLQFTGSTPFKGTDLGNSIRVRQLDMDASNITSITFNFKTTAEGTANFSFGSVKLGDLESKKIDPSLVSIGGAKSITVKNEEVKQPDDEKPPVETPDTKPTQPEQPSQPTQPEQPNQPSQPDQPSEPTFRNDNSTVYTTTSVNVRSSCSTENRSNILGLLKQGEEIKRTGISNEWDRVTYKGRVAYIRHGYLTTEKPDETDENNEVNETPADDNVIGNVVDNNVVDENTAIENNNVNEENSIVGDNNAIPGTTTGKDKKNGKLIAIVISAAAIVVVGIIMFIIYKKVNDEDEDEDEEIEEKPTPKASKTTGTGNSRTTTTRNTGTKNTNTRARSTATKTTGTKKTTTNKTTTGKKQ